jgi:hypothetical protein
VKVAALLFFVAVALSERAFGQFSGPLAVPDWAQPASVQEAQRHARLNAKWNVCVDLQMVALEEAKALELLPHLQSEDQAEADKAWSQLQAMIKAKEATLLAWPMVRTVDGSRAVSETILEKRYPTEFEPPQQPQTFSVGPEPKHGHVNAATVESTPNAYETRNVGVTLEIEPMVLGEGKRVYLRFESSRTELLGMEDFGKVLTVHNTLITVPQPLFLYLRSDLDLILQSGQRQLIAVHKLTKPVNLLELHLIRATVSRAE